MVLQKTWSNYQPSAVKKEWTQSMVKGQLERSCYWTVEMVQSGMFLELWELVLCFYGKYVHTANPKLPLYLQMRFETFKANTTEPEVEMRENVNVRKLFSEMVCILCLSPRRPCIEPVDIGKEGIPKSRLKAPSIEFNQSFQPTDPKELFVSMNEFSYMLHAKTMEGALYWLEWMLRFMRTHKCVAAPRGTKRPTDPIWLVWDTIRAHVSGELPKNVVNALVTLFGIAYTVGARERRKWLLYCGVSLCCEPVNFNVDMVSDKVVFAKAFEKCSSLFQNGSG